jgi:hypothetical protein
MLGPNKKNKIDNAKKEGVIVYDLINIKSGNIVSFLDEGPWIQPGVRDSSKPLSGSAQRLIACMQKKDDEGFPVFVSAEKLPPIQVPTDAGVISVVIPVVTDEIKERMKDWRGFFAEVDKQSNEKRAAQEALVATKADVDAKKSEILAKGAK